MKTVEVNQYIAIIGKNAHENWNILSKADQEWHFFHLTSFPSCYVVLKTRDNVSQDILLTCATICRDNTKHKKSKTVTVDHTLCGNVKKGNVIGELYYKSNRKVEKLRPVVVS